MRNTGMSVELAREAARVMSASLPNVTADVVSVPGTRKYVIIAVLRRGASRDSIVIKNATELGLILATVQQKSGRNLAQELVLA
jgi:hypothetical protein